MKTFFIAFVLGIFVGSIVTAYFTNPEAFDEFLQDASEKTGVEKEDIDQFKEKAGELFQQGTEKGKEIAKDTAEVSVALAIKAKWKANSSIDASNVKVSVEKGVAKLEGAASNREMADAIILAARNTPGVSEVDASELTIADTEPPPSE